MPLPFPRFVAHEGVWHFGAIYRQQEMVVGNGPPKHRTFGTLR